MEHLIVYIYKLILNATKALAIKMGIRSPDSYYAFAALNGPLKYSYLLVLPVLAVFLIARLVTRRIRNAQNRLFDERRLATYNGEHGRRRILLAVNGVVFDITARAHRCPAILRGRGVAHPAGVVARLLMRKLREKFQIVGHQYDYKPLAKLPETASEFLQYAVQLITEDDKDSSLLEEKGEKSSNTQESGIQQQEGSDAVEVGVKEQDNESQLVDASTVASELRRRLLKLRTPVDHQLKKEQPTTK